MKYKIILALLLLNLFANFNFAQEISNINRANLGIDAELESKAVKMLKETIGEIENLRTAENKISFSTEIANLLWEHDENEARRMFGRINADFINLLMQFNAEFNISHVPADSEMYAAMWDSGKRNSIMNFHQLMTVRKKIVLAIAENDSDLALHFASETSKSIPQKISQNSFLNPMGEDESALVDEIIKRMPVRNTDKAMQIGKEKLKNGFSEGLFDLVQKIHAEDNVKGKEFAEEIVSKIKSDKSKTETHLLTAILDLGKRQIEEFKKNPSEKLVFSESSLKDVAEVLAQKILAEKEIKEYQVDEYIESIESFSPSRAAQIKAKYENQKRIASVEEENSNSEMKDVTVSKAEKSENETNEIIKAMTEKKQKQEKLLEELNSLDSKKLSPEEKEKFLAKARQIVSAMDDPNQKLTALILLAAQVKQLGDKELASELMSQANAIVSPQPVNYLDYMQTWILVGGFSEVDAEKSFSLLENTIYRLNDMIAAFVKVGEFIDIGGSIIKDGEVQVGMFGEDFSRGILRGIGNTDKVLLNLAKKDFDRTRNLAEKFQRAEVRLLAKMLILQSLLEVQPEEIKMIDESSTLTSVPPPSPPMPKPDASP